jgi:hypothetical protein
MEADISAPLVSMLQGNATLAGVQFLRQIYLTRFSHPAQNRDVFREFYRRKPTSVFVLGVDSSTLAIELTGLMHEWHPTERLRLALLDPFDARPASAPKLTVRETNAQFAELPVRLTLHPGDPTFTLPRVANQLGTADVILLSPSIDAEAFAPSWYFLPRLMHATSVLLEGHVGPSGAGYRAVTAEEVSRRAERAGSKVRRAA